MSRKRMLVLSMVAGTLFAAAALAQQDLVIASKPTAKYDGVWGKGFLPPEKFVAMLYGNLKKK
jgi:hypothetical protein